MENYDIQNAGHWTTKNSDVWEMENIEVSPLNAPVYCLELDSWLKFREGESKQSSAISLNWGDGTNSLKKQRRGWGCSLAVKSVLSRRKAWVWSPTLHEKSNRRSQDAQTVLQGKTEDISTKKTLERNLTQVFNYVQL